MIILSAGGHAGVVIDALRTMGVIPLGALDSRAGEVNGVPVLGDDDYITRPEKLANGLGNRATRHSSGLSKRHALYRKFRDLGCSFPPVIHAAAIVSDGADVCDGAQIMAGAIVQTGARIGKNAIVNTRGLVEHDCTVGDHSHIAPGAILCGGVKVGTEVHVGAGAIVLQGVKIGDRAIIAAGAIVTRDVLAGECWHRWRAD
jgi:sugar O-acyltransferase (sialic acid O-acetyltransferase NeuD family)